MPSSPSQTAYSGSPLKSVTTFRPIILMSASEMKDANGEPAGLFYGDYFARPGRVPFASRTSWMA